MPSTHPRRAPRALLGLALPVFAASALFATTSSATGPAGTAGPVHEREAGQRLVVRGEATVTDAPCDAGICIALTDGRFRASPGGTGAYTGSVKLRVAAAFPNGEGGVCAPIDGDVVLGAGTPDKLVLTISGDSCQDGAGDPRTASFTGLARFTVRHATGSYRGIGRHGLASFSEDATDHDRMTLIGRSAR